MAGNIIAGVASLYVDGKAVRVAAQLTYRPTQSTRETLVGQDGVHGASEKPAAGFISAQCRDGGDVSVQDLGNTDNSTVVAQLVNGKLIIGRNMWRVGDPVEVLSEDATFEIRWEGLDVTEN